MFEFGPYLLDEPARVLRLMDREVPLQPRAFDLLVYLIRHRARVVSKDELLDTLWPGVTVTDNSLQRAVSVLRGALREGGMEEAIRNIPRSGYRFCLDSMPEAPESAEGISFADEARQAVQQQRWGDAVTLFMKAEAAGALQLHDLDRWAFALQCLGKPSDAIAVLVRLTAAATEAGDRERAASSAVALSTIHLERGEPSIAKGWLGRAQELVSDEPGLPAEGVLLWMQSRMAALDGEPQRAMKLADAAYEFGRRRQDVGVEAMGLMYRGFFRLSLGDTHGGLADQDHAATIALSSNVDPITGGVLYCNILWACRTFGDWARANQWTLGYQQYCTDNRMGFSGPCQLHRAEVLGIHGSLLEAHERINEALTCLSDDAPWAIGDAYRVLGDIESAIGNTTAADAAYDKSYALGWDPEPGRAMMLLERGEPEAAYACIERSLIGQSWWTLQRQGMLLAHLALVAAHAGRHEKAQALIDDLAGQDARWPMPSIRALTNEASALLLREHDANGALRHLHLARQLWTSIDSRLNAARLRISIAELQLSLGDRAGAATEIRTAAAAINELKSNKLAQLCQALQRKLEN